MKSRRGFWKLFKKKVKSTESQLSDNTSEVGVKQSIIQPEPDLRLEQPVIQRKKEKVFIQAGLDFGTSCTKVVFSQIGKRLSRAIDFQHGLSTYPDYCYPSSCVIDDDDRLLVGTDAARFLLDKEWNFGFQNLKMIVAGKYSERFKNPFLSSTFDHHLHEKGWVGIMSAEQLTAICLAYLMREVKSIISKYPEYRGVELDMSFNICMPIDQLESNPVRVAFEKIFQWAEAIEKSIMHNRCFDILDTSLLCEPTGSCEDQYNRRVFPVPESVAGFASYLMSLRKHDGLFAIIDLGSGTLDVSICKLEIHFDGSPSYWLSARNIPGGTRKIESIVARHASIDNRSSGCTHVDLFESLMTLCIEKKSNAYLFDDGNELFLAIFNELLALRKSEDYYKTWGAAYNRLRHESEWSKVEVFTCGGGSYLPYVEDVFSKPWWDHLHMNYPISLLPVPDDYDPGTSYAPFERMSVAYGLAKPLPMLESFVLPNDCPDFTLPPPIIKERNWEELYPDR